MDIEQFNEYRTRLNEIDRDLLRLNEIVGDFILCNGMFYRFYSNSLRTYTVSSTIIDVRLLFFILTQLKNICACLQLYSKSDYSRSTFMCIRFVSHCGERERERERERESERES